LLFFLFLRSRRWQAQGCDQHADGPLVLLTRVCVGVCVGGLGGLVRSGFCCVWLLLSSVSVGLCSRAASYASAVFCVGLCCWVGSLRVPFGVLLDFLLVPPFPLSRRFVAHMQMARMHPVLAPVAQSGSTCSLGSGGNVARAARMNHGDIQSGGTMWRGTGAKLGAQGLELRC
jgi:hypothetical protein